MLYVHTIIYCNLMYSLFQGQSRSYSESNGSNLQMEENPIIKISISDSHLQDQCNYKSLRVCLFKMI